MRARSPRACRFYSLCACALAFCASFATHAHARGAFVQEDPLPVEVEESEDWRPANNGRALLQSHFGSVSVQSIRRKLFDSTFTLQNMYGRGFEPKLTAGQKDKQMFVLGLHNSGTSVATRLIMLMGVFQGNAEDITVSPRNMLKYWERKDVFWTADTFLKNYSNRAFAPWQGQGINFSKVQQSHVDSLLLIAERTVADVSRHEPSVIKDPRLSWTFHFWKPMLERPMCVLVYKDPIDNAISLAENYEKSNFQKKGSAERFTMMTSQHWLGTWESTTFYALQSCVDVPTVIFNSKYLKTDIPYSVDYLYNALKHAGVEHLRKPDPQEIDAQIMYHFDDSHVVKKQRCQPEEQQGHTDTSQLHCSIVPHFTAIQETVNQVVQSTADSMMANLDHIAPSQLAATMLRDIEGRMSAGDWATLTASHPLPPANFLQA